MKVKEKVAGVGETYAVTLGVPEGPRPLGSPTRECPVKRTLCVPSRLKDHTRGRSQDGGGIGRGDHFLFYKFIERTTER